MSDESHYYRRGDALAPIALQLLGNPIDFLGDDHVQKREAYGSLDRIAATDSPDHVDTLDVLSFLKLKLPLHLADEEESLFPLMIKRCETEDVIGQVFSKMQRDHIYEVQGTSEFILTLEGMDTIRLAMKERWGLGDAG